MSEIVFNAPQSSLQDQIVNFQTTLASLNQQVISLQEALQERDQEIAELTASRASPCEAKTDETLTIVGLFINLYKFLVSLPAQQK